MIGLCVELASLQHAQHCTRLLSAVKASVNNYLPVYKPKATPELWHIYFTERDPIVQRFIVLMILNEIYHRPKVLLGSCINPQLWFNQKPKFHYKFSLS